jgi:hypothetical protein
LYFIQWLNNQRAINLLRLFIFVKGMDNSRNDSKIMLINTMTFPQFLESKFLEWQRIEGGRRTVAQFAQWLGFKPSTISMWWNSGVEPNGESAAILAQKLGLEVYDALSLPRPDEDLHYIQANWDRLSPETRKRMREQAENFAAENKKKKK